MAKKTTQQNKNLPMILIILDGWGIAPPSRGNAITLAKTPNLDAYLKNYPNTLVEASGRAVGLPAGQDGNSEAGHMNIGAGRAVEQDSVRISKTISNGTFFKNPAFAEAIRHVKQHGSNLHLMGMLGNEMSAHIDPDHLVALISLLENAGFIRINLHLFTDGRDSPKYSAIKLISNLEKIFGEKISINTLVGRYYAMDRTKNWQRTQLAYDALVKGDCRTAPDPQSAISSAYNRGESDEFVEPCVIAAKGKATPRISDNDSVIFFNLRSDRARQIAKAFVQRDFSRKNPGAFKRSKELKNLRFVAMTDFGPDLDQILSAFPSPDLMDTLPMQLKDLRQLYIAEQEKYAHVTYFFNGGYADPVAGEDRSIVRSPDVKSYDEVPAMSSRELTKAVIENLKSNRYDFTVLNFAAPDMIGHTGNLEAGINCCSQIDSFTGEIVSAYLAAGGLAIITADHGNVEEMINLETGEIDTEHSINPVPLIIVSHGLKNKIKLISEGVLGDIAPTILHLLGIDKPKEMTGKSLIR
jgi:2,3-bisphosphoglycerate-independent phosphoglycerate mutase